MVVFQAKESCLLAHQARLEEESLDLSTEIGSLKERYGIAMIDMTSMQTYLKRLIGNEAVAKYLREFKESFYDIFKEWSKNGKPYAKGA